MTVIFVNESTATTEDALERFGWKRAEVAVDVAAWLIALPGTVANVLCFLSCGHLPESTSGYLMRHLAI